MRTLTLAAPLLGLSLVLAACSSGGGATTAPSVAPASEAPSSAAPSEAPSASAAASESPGAAGGVTVNLGDTSLGSVLVDGDGKTLYIFTADSGGKSVCNGDCVATWPPLAGDGAPTLGAGLEAEDFTTITRDDGSTQIAFYGMPLYSFAGDAAAGDIKGQGLIDKWYVVDAEGKLIK
jgi:predicted lipoprotein with Yx(FWY)xxD motif